MPITVAVDAMGSDRAPRPEVAGALDAVATAPAPGEAPLEVLLVGDEPRLTALIDERCAELGLQVATHDSGAPLRVASYITTLVMNYLFTGRFKRTK